MAKTTKKKATKPPGTKDYFVRVDQATADKFDALVGAIEPRTSNSAMIGLLMKRWIAETEKR